MFTNVYQPSSWQLTNHWDHMIHDNMLLRPYQYSTAKVTKNRTNLRSYFSYFTNRLVQTQHGLVQKSRLTYRFLQFEQEKWVFRSAGLEVFPALQDQQPMLGRELSEFPHIQLNRPAEKRIPLHWGNVINCALPVWLILVGGFDVYQFPCPLCWMEKKLLKAPARYAMHCKYPMDHGCIRPISIMFQFLPVEQSYK